MIYTEEEVNKIVNKENLKYVIYIVIIACCVYVLVLCNNTIIHKQKQVINQQNEWINNQLLWVKDEQQKVMIIQSQVKFLNEELDKRIPKPLYQQIAENISTEHEWIYNQYMCKDFSSALVKALRQQGYASSMEFGYYFNMGNHQCNKLNEERFECKHWWVMLTIPIDAVSGKIISPEDYRNYYQEIK